MSFGGRLGYDDAGNTANTQVVLHDYPDAPLIFETRGLPQSKEAQSRLGRLDGQLPRLAGRRRRAVRERLRRFRRASTIDVQAFDNDGEEIEAWRGGGDHFDNFLDAVRSRKRGDLNADVLEGHLSSALCHTGNISHQLGRAATGERDPGRRSRTTSGSAIRSSGCSPICGRTKSMSTSRSSRRASWLEMDPATERFTNNDAANEMLRREDRQPFVVPEIA